MENIHTIAETHKANDTLTVKGFYIEVECCMCQQEERFVGLTKKEALTNMTDAGWRDLDSDVYGVSGFYCGCDYLDEEDKI